jgi:hypothetical protein
MKRFQLTAKQLLQVPYTKKAINYNVKTIGISLLKVLYIILTNIVTHTIPRNIH